MKYQAQALHVHDGHIEQQESHRKDDQSSGEGQKITFDVTGFAFAPEKPLGPHEPEEKYRQQDQNDDEQGWSGPGITVLFAHWLSHHFSPFKSAWFDAGQWTQRPRSERSCSVQRP